MASTETLIAFAIAAAVFAYVPGPAMLYAAGRTMAGGRRSGLLAAAGIHLGGYLHVLATAAGLTALLGAVPLLYTAVKLGGAAYLVWLGIGLVWRSATELRVAMPDAGRGRRAFLQSVTVEVLNPKTALFFVAFLPQFVDSAGTLPVWVQFLVLGSVVNVVFSSADLLCVLLAGAVLARLGRSGAVQRMVQRLGGALLVGLGTRLALLRV